LARSASSTSIASAIAQADHGEERRALGLAVEQIDHGRDRVELVRLVGVELELHGSRARV
jgi:hypothetical protein